MIVLALVSSVVIGSVPVHVSVRATGQTTSVANAYVALVPPHYPWTRPFAETIAKDGVAGLDVPPGDYLILAGAPGRGVATKGPVSVPASTQSRFEIELPSVQTVSGTVRDERGDPLSGVTVADVNAVVEPPLGRLSTLAHEHLAASWKTVSAADGTWSLSLPDGSRNPLVAQRTGYESGWISTAKPPTDPVAFVLSRGARLRMLLNRTDPGFAVSLIAAGKTPVIANEWQAQLWARRATTSPLQWDSLPAGTYDVYVQQTDPRSFAKAVKVASLDLAPGAVAEEAIELPVAIAVEEKAVTTALTRRSPRAALDALEVFGVDAAGVPRRLRHALEDVSGGTVIHFDSGQARAPFHAHTRDKFLVIAPPVDVTQTSSVLSATLLERADAGLHVRPAIAGMVLPRAGVAVFHRCRILEGASFAVPVRQDGTVLFEAPANCDGLSLTFEPFGPLMLSGALSQAGNPTWLGEFTLYEAGSAGVHVVTEADAAAADAVVTIHARGSDEGEVIPVTSRPTGADGWAYFDGLPAGRELQVTASTKEGHASLPRSFSVQPRTQTTIDPLVIARPATLIVEPILDPKVREVYPESHIEMIAIDRDGAASDSGRRRVSLAENVEHVTFESLQPGRWHITALVSIGTSKQPIPGEPVEIEAGAVTKVARQFRPYVFRGRVTSRGKPVPGNIDIIGRERSDVVPSISISATGEFLALLPRPDIYQVAVRTRNPMAMHWLGDVEFRDPARVVDLTLPDGEVVVAVRADGKAVHDLPVTALMVRDGAAGMQTLDVWGVTGVNGEARLDRMLPGNWFVSVADEGHDRYAEKRVTVGARPVRVELDLTPASAITGTVREAYGAPVAGARLHCIVAGEGGAARSVLATTAGDGTFRITSGGHEGAAVSCGVTSFAGADAYRVSTAEPSTLTLPARPATLEITNVPSVTRFESLWLVTEDGRLLDVSEYLRHGSKGASIVLPAIAPGRWKLVRISSTADWMAMTTGGAALLPVIANAALEAGTRTTISLSSP